MDIFSNLEILQLTACGITFLVGVTICVHVSIKDTIELRERRKAKRLMLEDELRRRRAARSAYMSNAQTIDMQPSHPVPTNRETVA